MAEPAVELRDVRKAFGGDRPALSGISLRIETGETIVLLGSSGSGKTTTLKTINRLVTPDSGEIYVRGKEVGSWDPIDLRRQTGYVIQEVGLLPHLSVEDNIGLVPRLAGWTETRRRERTLELLELVSLEPGTFAHKRPRELSGGQRQRVGVARALAADPPLLLMDEPFGALDPINRRRLQDEFRELRDRLNKTIVFVTHDVPEALRLAHRIGVMHEGKLLQLDAPRTVLEQPADAFVRDLVRLDTKEAVLGS
jgi:osmoprotectant transport system ATP-binding protein